MSITCLVTRLSATNQCQSSIIGRTFKRLSSHRRKTFPGTPNISSGRPELTKLMRMWRVESDGGVWCLQGAESRRGKNADPGDLSLTDFINHCGGSRVSSPVTTLDLEIIKRSSNISISPIVFANYKCIFPRVHKKSKIRSHLDCLQCSFITKNQSPGMYYCTNSTFWDCDIWQSDMYVEHPD